MDANRKFLVFGFLGICLFFFILDVMDVIFNIASAGYFWGLPFGFLFGVATSLLLSEKWDPVHLRPKDSNAVSGIRWQWSVPLGVLAANILLGMVNNIVADFIAGIIGGWLYTVLGYLALQIWRHRPE